MGCNMGFVGVWYRLYIASCPSCPKSSQLLPVKCALCGLCTCCACAVHKRPLKRDLVALWVRETLLEDLCLSHSSAYTKLFFWDHTGVQTFILP